MTFPDRLVQIEKLIPDGSYVADIGADHGLLELLLIANKKDIKILAIENKKGPFEILSKKVGGQNNISLSFSDGISEINDNIDTLVLAGMGGLNICSILDAHKEKLSSVKTIIIDAHRDIEKARAKITSYGFEIQKEKIVYESNKFYVIILFNKIKTTKKLLKNELEFGINLYNDPLWEQYKNSLIEQRKKVISKLNENSQKKYLIEDEIRRLENYGKDEII